jgi:hypothetical protein
MQFPNLLTVFGFAQTTLVGPEKDGLYTIGFGFLSGAATNTFVINLEVTLITAGTFSTIFHPQLRVDTDTGLALAS